MSHRAGSSQQLFQLEIKLRDISPPIWRRFLISQQSTFYELHLVLQAVMGWKNVHLYQFNVDDVELSDPITAAEFGGVNAEIVHLDQLLAVGQRFIYEYDFGDGWEHEIVVEAALAAEPGQTFPRCLSGRRACPPEDCGGVWGYADLLLALQDPEHGQHDEMLAWVSGHFDADYFDVAATNATLRTLA